MSNAYGDWYILNPHWNNAEMPERMYGPFATRKSAREFLYTKQRRKVLRWEPESYIVASKKSEWYDRPLMDCDF